VSRHKLVNVVIITVVDAVKVA
jgi:hypothetical protein